MIRMYYIHTNQKFLGVTLDPKLAFTKETERNISNRINQRINILKVTFKLFYVSFSTSKSYLFLKTSFVSIDF